MDADRRVSASAVVRMVNADLRVRLGGFLPWLLGRRPSVVLTLGFAMYVFVALFFAGPLYAAGEVSALMRALAKSFIRTHVASAISIAGQAMAMAIVAH